MTIETARRASLEFVCVFGQDGVTRQPPTLDGGSTPSVGFAIFCESIPLLVSSAMREASRLIPMLPLVRCQDDEPVNM